MKKDESEAQLDSAGKTKFQKLIADPRNVAAWIVYCIRYNSSKAISR